MEVSVLARILVVDDDRSITELIKRQLSKVGEYEVAVVYDGESALELITRWTPDLVLLDIMMPGIDGQEVCRRMRESEAMTPVPIIMLTALGDIDSKRTAFGAGADDYITKPHNSAELLLRVGAHLQRAERLAELRAAGIDDDAALLPHRIPRGEGEPVSQPPMAPFAEESPTVSVVVPTLNEAENLPYVLPRIPRWVDEVILADGHSTDGTVEVARELLPDIRVVMQEGRGKGDALRCGFNAARGDIIVAVDADGSNDPAEIPFFVGALLSGADYAKGSRFLQGAATVDMPLYRILGNWVFVLMVRILFGGTYTDLLYGYNAFWSHVLPHLALDVEGFEVETAMNVRVLKAGLHIVEVASFEAERMYGDAKLQAFPDGWRILKTIVQEFVTKWSSRPKAVTLEEVGQD
jgi:CheY-like chemotaxis protein